MNSRVLDLPTRSGAYRWYYADVNAGETTAVVIFMIGAVFSPRYSGAAARGGKPIEHCAVNFALYHQGVRRQWVLSQYPGASIEASGNVLRVGGSMLRYEPDGRVVMEINDHTAPWGRPAKAVIELTPQCERIGEVQLAAAQPHYWQPLAPRCRATVTLLDQGSALHGSGYHDTNRGDEPLGTGLAGWRWTRIHGPASTEVLYQPRGSADELQLIASARGVCLERTPPSAVASRRTGWGLSVPTTLGAVRTRVEAPRLLESSPFYARLEARAGSSRALSEVADFEKFHRPHLRWMAHFRIREGSAA